jgi:2-haloacid dehalogenase
MKLSDFKALTFDCYGTLIDWESGIIEALRPIAARASHDLSRNDILAAHARHESSQQTYSPHLPYSRVLAVVAKRLAEEWGADVTWDQCLAYGNSVQDWPAFPDSVAALDYLKQHYKLVILSNVDNASFVLSGRRLGVIFDAVYTAEDIGSYKPASRNFDYLINNLKTLGIDKGEILHTAESLFHDHVPAQQHGLARCWIHRRHALGGFGATVEPADIPPVNFRFTSLKDMADAHRTGH